MSLHDAERLADSRLDVVARSGPHRLPVGPSDRVLFERWARRAYPIVDGVPVLLAPERLEPEDIRNNLTVDLASSRYAEAYAEMDFYNQGDVTDDAMATLARAIANVPNVSATFPQDPSIWVEAPYDGEAQWDCYKAIGPLDGRTAMQLGGGGLHAVKFLLAGADSAILVTPMHLEAQRAQWLARQVGMEARLHVALGLAEELPLPDRSVDAIFAGGCVHHMQVKESMREVRRVLSSGGVFAATEPWRAPLYSLGTRVLGKREANAHCQPLTAARIEPFLEAFEDARIIHHGTMSRYFLIALSKTGHRPSPTKMRCVTRFDDRLSDRLGIRRHGSSIAMVASSPWDR